MKRRRKESNHMINIDNYRFPGDEGMRPAGQPSPWEPSSPGPAAPLANPNDAPLRGHALLGRVSKENTDVHGPTQERTPEAVACFRVLGHGKTRFGAARRFAKQERCRDGWSRSEELGAQRAVAEAI